MYDIVAVGECLIDFTPSGFNEAGIQLFGCNPGGAPANVLAMNAKLGGKTAFIGKVGRDSFGAFLKRTIEDAGIESSGMRLTSNYPTTLAFVQLTPKGERSFSFYRKSGADVMLEVSDLDRSLIEHCKIFHFGSVSLTDEPSRSATLEAVKLAKRAGAIISYDPNYRELLWDNRQRAIDEMSSAAELADIIKVSEEELFLLTGTSDFEVGARFLSEQGIQLIVITLGAQGAYYHTATTGKLLPTFQVDTIDTTGAGDAFVGALLYRLQGYRLDQLSTLTADQLDAMISFANAAGSLTTTGMGAIPAMPERSAIEECVKSGRLLCNV